MTGIVATWPQLRESIHLVLPKSEMAPSHFQCRNLDDLLRACLQANSGRMIRSYIYLSMIQLGRIVEKYFVVA